MSKWRAFWCIYLSVDAEREHHQEEQDGPERRKGELGNGERKDDKCEAGTRSDHIMHILSGCGRQVANVGENDKAGKKRRKCA